MDIVKIRSLITAPAGLRAVFSSMQGVVGETPTNEPVIFLAAAQVYDRHDKDTPPWDQVVGFVAGADAESCEGFEMPCESMTNFMGYITDQK